MSSVAQLAECLTATLNSNPNVRISAELKLAELSALPETGVFLAQLALSSEAELPLRQSASIVLRKYVVERWSPIFPQFRGPAPPQETKAAVRQMVFQGLSDPDRKIRSLCARTMSTLANADWPDENPELLASLISLLSSGSPNSVHGAMQVFAEFIKADLSEDQILPILRELLPVLLNVLGGAEQYGAITRARTVSVFQQCVEALFMVKDQHPQAVKEATTSILPTWLEAFRVLLSIDPSQDLNKPEWDGLLIRIQIFKTLDIIHTSFPRAMVTFLPDILNSALNHLQTVFPAFQQYYLSATESPPPSSEDETIHLPQLICPILDFLSSVIRGGKAKAWFEGDNLTAVISAVFNYAQMTDEDEETWASNANAFVAQEDDETQEYSVRVAGFDVLAVLMEREGAKTASTCQSLLQHMVQSSQQARDGGQDDWWRPLEASLASIGSQSEAILDCVEDEMDSGRPKPIDVEYILRDIVPSVLGLSAQPFLQGRGFVFASQYAKLLPLQLAGQYLDAAIQVIEASDAGVPVKVSAVRAVHNFCQGAEDSAMVPFVSRIAKDLGPFLLDTSDDALSLVLETMSVVVQVDDGKWLTPDLAQSLVAALLEVWKKNNKDPIFESILSDIFEALASSKASGVYQAVVQKALPELCSNLAEAKPEESWVTSTGIELITSMVKGAPEGGLGDGFVAAMAPSLFHCLGQSEDRDVLQNGVSCLTTIVRKDCKQLAAWSDGSRGGLEHVLALIARVLQSEDESGGLFIGDLIIHLLRNAGDTVLPVLPELLQAMVNRMLTAKTATFLQSLVIPFAFLITSQRDTVLQLLEGINVGGRSGLDVLLQTWCENAETFQGFWPGRVSTLGLCELLRAARPSLQQVTVKGDIILRPETKNVIMTRSRTKKIPHEFTAVPFPVKALKIIVRDLLTGGESAAMGAIDEADVNSEDGDDDWEEDGTDVGGKVNSQGFTKDEFAFLSEMIGPRGVKFDNDDVLDDDDDEDLKNDPISQMDMQSHLVSFLRDCAAQNTSNFSQLVSQLSPEEQGVVQRAVSQ
ncbi:armadillo-type protein [Schizophyllum amplum]|uniref:Armadillo-type protein n=1 Tax=Schizophyllum amplum TaxID=97359 RepID=A0A550D068_9AGAR|nr:armadillo-type protein [Auriculariopsis ampla]